MLTTLRSCPAIGNIVLDQDFQKDLNWFSQYLPATNVVYIMIYDDVRRGPIHLYMDVCSTGGVPLLGPKLTMYSHLGTLSLPTIPSVTWKWLMQ